MDLMLLSFKLFYFWGGCSSSPICSLAALCQGCYGGVFLLTHGCAFAFTLSLIFFFNLFIAAVANALNCNDIMGKENFGSEMPIILWPRDVKCKAAGGISREQTSSLNSEKRVWDFAACC